MNRITLLNEINHYLSLFTLEVEKFNTVNLYDVNIHAENVAVPLLNAVYGLELVNANLIEKNFPAVDLVDYENRIAIQVTATADSDKIAYTIQKFREKGLHEYFDTLMVYILSKKLAYRVNFAELAGDVFAFTPDEHIIDNTDLFRLLSGMPNITLLRKVRDHLADEFSTAKQHEREHKLTQEVISVPQEPYILNFVGMTLPERLYVAPVDLDQQREALTADIQTYRKTQQRFRRGRRRISNRDLVRKAIAKAEQGFCHDWVLYGGNLITFRNLHDSSELLRAVIDTGSIESMNAAEFWQKDDNYLRSFKHLVGMSLRQMFLKIGVEWEPEQEIYRFRASEALSPIKVTWKKDKRNATREVFSEIWDETKDHVVCFRHLGFSATQEVFDEAWHLTIKPTWSFTSNGKVTSRYAPTYASKLKRLENNSAVHNHFRFIADYLARDQDIDAPTSILPDHQELATDSYEITLLKPLFFEYRPAIVDADWLPEKPVK